MNPKPEALELPGGYYWQYTHIGRSGTVGDIEIDGKTIAKGMLLEDAKAFAAAMQPKPTASAMDAAREICGLVYEGFVAGKEVGYEENKAAAIIQRLLDTKPPFMNTEGVDFSQADLRPGAITTMPTPTAQDALREALALLIDSANRYACKCPAGINSLYHQDLMECLRKGKAALAAPRAEGWQDISTAPKDETTVMLWACGRDDVPSEYRVHIGEWFRDSWWTIDDLDTDYDGYGSRLYLAPTHWQPLPQPPENKKEAE